MVLWQPVQQRQMRSELTASRAGRFDGIKAMVDDNGIAVNEPKAIFFARLDRAAQDQTPTRLPSDTNVLVDLLTMAGLEVSSVLEHTIDLEGRYLRKVATVIAEHR